MILDLVCAETLPLLAAKVENVFCSFTYTLYFIRVFCICVLHSVLLCAVLIFYSVLFIKLLITILGHSAHLGTATCPSSKLVPKFEKGDNLMKHVYLAYGGNG